jgi:hypothetical protein
LLRSSSPDALARHLLRHLMDLRELQRNGLAAAFLRELPSNDSLLVRHEKTVRWIRKGVASMALGRERNAHLHSEILRRCDLLGETHAAVWFALGLSRRAFYYERREALTRLAMLLRADARRATMHVRHGLDVFELRLASARSLQNAGHLELALHESEELIDAAASPEQRVRACAVALESQFLRGRCDDARLRLMTLEQQLGGLSAGSARDAAALIVAATACANARWNLGEAGEALERLRAAERAFAPQPTLLEDQRVAHAWAQALLRIANFHAITGDASAALSVVADAAALLSRSDGADPDVRAELSTMQAFVVLTLDRPLVEAEAPAQAALTLAQEHGLVGRAVEAAAMLSLVQAVSGDYRAALRTGHSGLSLAHRLPTHQVCVFLRLILARIYAARHDAATSCALLDEASREIPAGSALGVFRDTTAAAIALASHSFRAALQRSQAAADAAHRSGFRRVTGAAMALQAKALYALDRPRAAAAAADAAVAILERVGARYSLAEAYDLSGRLTCNRRHARLASELRAILTSRAHTSAD